MLSLSIWGEHQPDHPECALRTYVSRIRAALPADFPESFLVTLDGAYRVDPPPGTLDMDLFGQLLAEATDAAGRGDFRAAASLLQRALACWKSPPGTDHLPDLPDTPEIASQTARLFEQRRQAELRLFDLQLALGRHEEVVPELSARVHLDPGSERTWAQLMLALSRSGRRSEALDAYHRARRTLADKYGTNPGEDMQSALTRILRDDEEDRSAASPPQSTRSIRTASARDRHPSAGGAAISQLLARETLVKRQ
jgi:DNA-binding SARP family transcriptional activator